MISYHLAPSYVNTFLSQNIKNGMIFSATTQTVEGTKRVAGRLVNLDHNSFTVKPMNGRSNNDHMVIGIHQLEALKVKGTEYNILH